MVAARELIYWLTALIVLAAINVSIWQREEVLADGRDVVLALAPVDPRSLMQGDFMRLNYALQRLDAAKAEARGAAATGAHRGTFVLTLDDAGVASFARLDDGSDLAANEVRLNYKWRDRIKLPGESYFFQEGTAELFQGARFGLFKVDDDGKSVLAALLDENLEPIATD